MSVIETSVCEEIFSLQDSYDVEIGINGTDQKSIQEGMAEALSSLIINITGNSVSVLDKSIIAMMKSPQKYVSKYSLSSQEEKLIAHFVFDGDSLRSYLGESQLPLWLSNKITLLTFLPCEKLNTRYRTDEDISACSKLRQDLSKLSDKRNSVLTSPLIDLNEMASFESLGASHPERFMNKISRKYELSNWLYCSIRNEFGLLIENPLCISSQVSSKLPPKEAINSLIDKINADKSLIIDKNIKNSTYIGLSEIDTFRDLELALDELTSQVLVTNVTLKAIKGASITLFLSHFGNEEDLINLLNMNAKFEEINSTTEDIILFNYISG